MCVIHNYFIISLKYIPSESVHNEALTNFIILYIFKFSLKITIKVFHFLPLILINMNVIAMYIHTKYNSELLDS